MKTLKYLLYSALLSTALSCSYDFPEKKEITAGSANFSKYIAIGNSLTAGYMDGTLYDRGQQNSFSVILANQMKLVGGGEFNVPTIASPNGFFGVAPDGQTPLGRLKLTAPGGSCSPAPAPTLPGKIPTLYEGDKSKLNNFGVPGLSIVTATMPQTGGPATNNPYFNPYYWRIASNPGTSTLIGDAVTALSNGGTFFSFWLGNNDILGYATSGASRPEIFPPTAVFEAKYKEALGAVLAVPNTKGAVANIPYVTDIPFFNTVNQRLTTPTVNPCISSAPASALPFALTAQQATALNMKYKSVGIDAKFKEGKENFFLIVTPGGVRQMNPREDFIVLNVPSDSLGLGELKKCDCSTRGQRAGWGVTKPIETRWVLDASEVSQIRTRADEFNAIIKSQVDANSDRLVLVDINSSFGVVAKGATTINGILLGPSIAPPYGGFSLDGVHPNARGSAFAANEFIKAINLKFGSTIPLVNPNDYPGNDLPTQ